MKNPDITDLLSKLVEIPSISSLDENQKDVLDSANFISDLFFQSFGFIAYLISFTYIITGINIFRLKEFFLIIENIFYSILYSIFGSIFLNHFYKDRPCA